MLRDGAERQDREESKSREDVHDKHQNNGKREGIGMQSTDRVVDEIFLHQRSGDGQLNDNGQIPSKEHSQTGCDIPEHRVIGQSLKTGTVVGR